MQSSAPSTARESYLRLRRQRSFRHRGLRSGHLCRLWRQQVHPCQSGDVRLFCLLSQLRCERRSLSAEAFKSKWTCRCDKLDDNQYRLGQMKRFPSIFDLFLGSTPNVNGLVDFHVSYRPTSSGMSCTKGMLFLDRIFVWKFIKDILEKNLFFTPQRGLSCQINKINILY